MTTKEKKPKRAKRRFDEQFRRDAVALVESTGQPVMKIARQLGVSHWNLYDWIEIHGQGAPTQASTVQDLQRVIARLQGEKESIQAERDVLKKALGILAEPSRTVTPS
jgi:transposase